MRKIEQPRRVQLELDVRLTALEITKKDPSVDPNQLTNTEKAAVVTALRGKWKLCELLPMVRMAKSSYEYARKATSESEHDKRTVVKEAIVAAFEASGGTYGYRRIVNEINGKFELHVGEWTVRNIMREENLIAHPAKRTSQR